MMFNTVTVIDEERICSECMGVMTLAHKGQFCTVYVCPACGSMLTIPPREPAISKRE